MKVVEIEGRDAACDAFVESMPNANLCHLTAYSEMVRRASGHRVYHLAAIGKSGPCGVLPLTHVKSRLFGNRMVSHAYRNYGGPLAADAASTRALFDRAVELGTGLGCESIEFRNVDPLPFELELRTGKVCMLLPLAADPEAMWTGLNFKMRNHVRKAEKSGLTAVEGGLELLDDFYAVYTTRLRELGTPAFGRGVMKEMLEAFPGHARLFAVRLGAQTLAAGITTTFRGVIEIPYAASLSEFNKLAPNNLLYWTILRRSCEQGLQAFDFGRCTVDSGTFQFKKQWGAEPVALHYQYWVRPGTQLSIASPDNPRYHQRIELWRRLPLWATRVLGPVISRGLP